MFSVMNMHYPALASAPGPFCCGSGEYPACWRQAASSAGALWALRKFGQKKTRTAPLAESSQKIILLITGLVYLEPHGCARGHLRFFWQVSGLLSASPCSRWQCLFGSEFSAEICSHLPRESVLGAPFPHQPSKSNVSGTQGP